MAINSLMQMKMAHVFNFNNKLPMNMLYTRDLITRLFLTDFTDLPLEIARKVISRMTDEDICKDFNMEVIRKGYFIPKIN